MLKPTLSEKRIIHYFYSADKESRHSDNTKAHVGCVIVYKGKIIGSGCNMEKTHPVQKHYDKYKGYGSYSIHAECQTILQVAKSRSDIDWSKAHIFVSRSKKDGSYGMSRPCAACRAMILEYGIKNVYYTTETGWCYERFS